MTGVLEQLGWLVLAVAVILGFIWVVNSAGQYYANPDEDEPLLGRHHVPRPPEDAVPDAQQPNGGSA
jgi:hypothetical protein